MSIFHGPKIPAPAQLPGTPALNDANVQAAGNEARANAAAAYGRAQTILTSGKGVTQPAQIQRAALLGGTGAAAAPVSGSPLEVMTKVVGQGELSKILNAGLSTY